MTPTFESSRCDRRAFLTIAGGTLAGFAASTCAMAPRISHGLVVCEGTPAETGMQILSAGGNAVDAAVATALSGCVVNVSKCGIGGYGGHMVIALPNGRVTAIDFNSTAPAAARADMFPLDGNGSVGGKINERGWLAAGVPGTLAGLQLAIDRYGTLPFARVVQPAIQFARDGVPLRMAYTYWRDPARPDVPRDSTSARLFSRNGKPLRKGDIHRNTDLADMLQQLAEDGSVEAFYRGDIAQRIADAFQKNGGLVTAEDMASYQAREVTPLTLDYNGHRIATAPLTAGGLTILQALAALDALGWRDLPAGPTTTHAWIEALRIAWADRLALLGDPEHAEVPVERLLSARHARQSATKIKSAVADRRPVPLMTEEKTSGGTFHVSAVDRSGMMVAMTLTHGNSFGAQVAVDGLGLILGHGMSRFDPVPGRPNSIAPGKRPLHNMCPAIVLRDGRPMLALGATGGRRIVNAIFQVLLSCLGEGRSLTEAVSAPRLHTEGGLKIHAEPTANGADLQHLQRVGYEIVTPLASFVYAVEQPGVNGPDSTSAVAVADHVAEEGGIRDAQPLVTRQQL